MGTIVLEGLGRQLDPHLNFLQAAVPYVFKTEGGWDMVKAWGKRLLENLKHKLESLVHNHKQEMFKLCAPV